MNESNKSVSCIDDSDHITFVNEHQLHRKNVGLHLGIDNIDNNTDDQTPTPTRFIRNCEEVGLFQDLQNVNPFEETFRKAATELATHGSLHVPKAASNDDSLHTPHILPYISQKEKYPTSDDDFSVGDDILVINESKITQHCHSTFNFNTLEENVTISDVEKQVQKGNKSKRTVQIQKQRELNRAAQVRSRAKKKLMFHKLIEEVSLLKSQTKELAKDNEKLRKEVVWLKTILSYHKDCPVSKNPQITKEVNLLAKPTEETHPVTTMLVTPLVISSPVPQLVNLQSINGALLVKAPATGVPNASTSRLTPLLPKTAASTETSRLSNVIQDLRNSSRVGRKKNKQCAKSRHPQKELDPNR